MPANPRDRMVYIDEAGEPQCATGAGLIPVSGDCLKHLNELRGHLELALACAAQLGGIPVPVKQALQRELAESQGRLAGAHLLHDLEILCGPSNAWGRKADS